MIEKRSNRWGFFSLTLILLLIAGTSAWSEPSMSIQDGREGHPKLESALFDLQKGYLLGERGGAQAIARKLDLRVDDSDKVTVLIQPKSGEVREVIDIDTLRAYGGEVIKQGRSVIKAKVPIALLDLIADRVEGVNFIRRPDRPHAKVVSQGVSLTGASLYHASGFGGQNVKVAIIDLGFDKLSQAISAGVLPSSVVKIDCTGSECSPTDFLSEEEEHGTAVAEVVHDMAPDAELYLIKIDDNLDLMAAKDYCIANGIRIINHSVGWYISNFYDGTCYFDNAVCSANHAYKNGILWVNSAGNDARSHYQATFIDRDGDRLHNVAEDNNFIGLYAQKGDYIVALLTWDAWPETDQDYDLLLFNSSKELIASSTIWQTGTQPPQEGIVYFVPASGNYYLAVQNVKTTSSHRFSIFNFNQDLNPYVASSSLVSPADAAGVMAVAAIEWSHWLTGPQESYSSQGPTTDGRMKPEISGPDGVSSFVYDSFYGTSSSSPHVAGAAALILSNSPDFTVSQIWNVLVSSAVDLGSAGQDPIFGHGRLNLSTLSVDPVSIDFNDVPLGSFIEKVITVQNIGSQNLAIGSVAAPNVPYSLVSDSCSNRSLPLGETCALTVRFNPVASGSFNDSIAIPSNDPFRGSFSVSLKGSGVRMITLLSPADPFYADLCLIHTTPLFQWEVRAPFTQYEIEFSSDPTFAIVTTRIKVQGKNPASSLSSSQWKKVLTSAGPEGGMIYWRVLGTKPKGGVEISNQRPILVPAPEAVENPVLSPVSRTGLPVLTWQNQCNSKLKVWFGIDPGLLRTSVTIQVPDPTANGGNLSKTLTSGQWLKIRKLVGDKPGSRIYWYVDSWDTLNRYSATEVMSFILGN